MGAFNPMDMFQAGGQLGQANASPFTYGSQNVMDQFKMGQQLQMQLAGQLGLKNAENQLPLNPTTQAKEVSETNKNNAISSMYTDNKNSGAGPPILDAQGNPIGNFGGGLKRDLLQAQVTNAQMKPWDKIATESDPGKASSRSTLGMASNANLRVDRAKVTLNNPLVTNQDAQNVFADIAGVYAGGSPTDIGMEHGSYDSIQQKLAGLQQNITGNPTGVLTPEAKQHISGVLDDLKNTNNQMIGNHFDYYEKAYPQIISAHQNEWNGMKASVLPNKIQQAASGNGGDEDAKVATLLRGNTDPSVQKAILNTYKQRHNGREYGQ